MQIITNLFLSILLMDITQQLQQTPMEIQRGIQHISNQIILQAQQVQITDILLLEISEHQITQITQISK